MHSIHHNCMSVTDFNRTLHSFSSSQSHTCSSSHSFSSDLSPSLDSLIMGNPYSFCTGSDAPQVTSSQSWGCESGSGSGSEVQSEHITSYSKHTGGGGSGGSGSFPE